MGVDERARKRRLAENECQGLGRGEEEEEEQKLRRRRLYCRGPGEQQRQAARSNDGRRAPAITTHKCSYVTAISRVLRLQENWALDLSRFCIKIGRFPSQGTAGGVR